MVVPEQTTFHVQVEECAGLQIPVLVCDGGGEFPDPHPLPSNNKHTKQNITLRQSRHNTPKHYSPKYDKTTRDSTTQRNTEHNITFLLPPLQKRV